MRTKNPKTETEGEAQRKRFIEAARELWAKVGDGLTG